MGITLLKRAGGDTAGNWPMARKSGHIALESNSKGFVITRLSTVEIQDKPAQQSLHQKLQTLRKA
jgi:hypothetical protein